MVPIVWPERGARRVWASAQGERKPTGWPATSVRATEPSVGQQEQ